MSLVLENFIDPKIINLGNAPNTILSSIKSPLSSISKARDACPKLTSYFTSQSAKLTPIVTGFASLSDVLVWNGSQYDFSPDDYPSDYLDYLCQAIEYLYNVFVSYGEPQQNGSYALTLMYSDPAYVVIYGYRNPNNGYINFWSGSPSYYMYTTSADGHFRFTPRVRNNSGQLVNLSSVIASLTANSEMIDLLCSATSSVSRVNTTVNDLEATLAEYSRSKYEEVSSLALTIKSNFAKYGVIGVLGVVKSIYTTLSSISDDDGEIVLTDNASLMPVDYISGIIDQVINTVSQAVSVVLTVIQPVLGILSFVFGSALSLLTSKLQYDYDTATRCAIIEDSNASFYPFALNQVSKGSSSISYSNIEKVKLYAEDAAPFFIDSVGLRWLFSSNSDGTITGEAHIKTDSFIWKAAQILNIQSQTTHPGFYHNTLTLNAATIDQVNLILLNPDNHYVVNDVINGTLNPFDDAVMRINAGLNLLLHWAYYNNLRDAGNKTNGFSITWEYSEDQTTTNHVYSFNDISLLSTSGWYPTYAQNFIDSKLSEVLYKTLKAIKQVALLQQPAYQVHSLQELFEKYPQALVGYGAQWDEIISACSFLNYQTDDIRDADSHLVIYMCNNYYDTLSLSQYSIDVYPINSDVVPEIAIPRYKLSTFWSGINLAAMVSTLVVITSVAIGLTVKRLCNRWATLRSAKIEQAWTNLANNPTAANADAYRKLVSKNNILSSIFGGTKYNRMGYWLEPKSVSTYSQVEPSATTSDISGLDSKLDAIIAALPSDYATTSDVEDAKDDITLLITGH